MESTSLPLMPPLNHSPLLLPDGQSDNDEPGVSALQQVPVLFQQAPPLVLLSAPLMVLASLLGTGQTQDPPLPPAHLAGVHLHDGADASAMQGVRVETQDVLAVQLFLFRAGQAVGA